MTNWIAVQIFPEWWQHSSHWRYQNTAYLTCYWDASGKYITSRILQARDNRELSYFTLLSCTERRECFSQYIHACICELACGHVNFLSTLSLCLKNVLLYDLNLKFGFSELQIHLSQNTNTTLSLKVNLSCCLFWGEIWCGDSAGLINRLWRFNDFLLNGRHEVRPDKPGRSWSMKQLIA